MPPLTPAEAYARACLLMSKPYQSFDEKEARRIIAGLLEAIAAPAQEPVATAQAAKGEK